MSIITKIILEATTAQAISDEFTLENDSTNVTVTCANLTGSETATLQYYDEILEQWVDYIINNSLKQFSVTNNKIVVENEFSNMRFSKTATVNQVGIYIKKWGYQ
jgi:hypothetical protein